MMKPVTWKSQINKFKPTSIIIGSLGGNDVSRLQTAESTQRHFKKYVKPMLDKLKKINTNISWSGPAPTGQSPRKVKKRKIAANNLGGAMAEYNNLAKPKEKTGIVKYYNISDMLKTSPNFKPVVYKHRFDKWGKEMPAKSRKYWGDTLHYREEPAKYYAEHVLNLLDIPKQPPIVDTKTPVDTSVPAEKTTNELKEKVLNI